MQTTGTLHTAQIRIVAGSQARSGLPVHCITWKKFRNYEEDQSYDCMINKERELSDEDIHSGNSRDPEGSQQ